jgi:SAM-dependent methyltransferase
MPDATPGSAMERTDATLDYSFLKYLQVSVDGEAALHGFYLPLLAGYDRVLDLGCGLGGFVKLLCDHGQQAYGVDSDPLCIAEARRAGISVVEADVLAHLREVPAGSLDAIFSAHLIEHMPYDAVLATVEAAYRALRPGGRLLLVTPNPRALVAHLELYFMHFGHVAMYHPTLIEFFMHHVGFRQTAAGENPATAAAAVTPHAPVAQLHRLAAGTPATSPALPFDAVLPRPVNPVRRLLWQGKMALAQWLVRPYYDQVSRDLAAMQAAAAQTHQQFAAAIDAVDRPFECYVVGDKGQAN